MERFPLTIYDKKNDRWIFSHASNNMIFYHYEKLGIKTGMIISKVETDFTKKDRPIPKSKIITQGKYECAAASLAMLINKDLFFVKRALAKHGWRNDDSGANSKQIILAAKEFGINLEFLPKEKIDSSVKKGLVQLKSINVKGYSHVVAWNGEEILDPQFNNPHKFSWGPEWAPWTLPCTGMLIVV